MTAQDVMTTDFPVLTNYMTLNSLRKLVHDSVKNPSKVLPLVDSKCKIGAINFVTKFVKKYRVLVELVSKLNVIKHKLSFHVSFEEFTQRNGINTIKYNDL